MIVAEVEPHHYLPDSTAWVDIEPAEVSGFNEVRAVREQYERRRRRSACTTDDRPR